MRFVLHSDFGDACFLARRLLREGHDVTVWIRDPHSRVVNEGLVPHAPSAMVPEGTDCVIFDGVGHGQLGKALRARGIPCIGGNTLDEELELNRSSGTKLMEAAGIKTPETRTFTDIHQAQAFLATHPGHWFLKPDGNKATDLTRNGESKALVRFLRWAGAHAAGDFKVFEVQRAVRGTEVSCEGWFNGKDWIRPFNATLETKKFLPGPGGGIGPRTGCAGNVVWCFADDLPRLAARTVVRLTPWLRQARYVGPLDLNMILDEEGVPHGLEFSARLGFDASQAWSMLINANLGQQLVRCARGTLVRWDQRVDVMAGTLRLSTPPYPIESKSIARETRGLPLDPRLFEHPERTFLDDVMVGRDGKPAIAGRDGSVGCIGTLGQEWATMQAALLKRADEVDIPSKQYRSDCIPDVVERLQALRRHGYLSASEAPRFSVPREPPGAGSGGSRPGGGADSGSESSGGGQAPFMEDTEAA